MVPGAAAGRGRRSAVAWGVAAVAVVVAGFGWLRPVPEPETTRFPVGFPRDAPLIRLAGWMSFDLSPDGRTMVYQGSGPDEQQLFLRHQNDLDARPIAGTKGGSGPFFSPDGRWIGFFASSRLKKVQLEGGPPVTLADVGSARGGVWMTSGDIVYTPSTGEGLWSVPADGAGSAERLTLPDTEAGESSHRWPDELPDGSILFTTWTGDTDDIRLRVYDPETEELTEILRGGMYGRWSRTGHLVYAGVEGTLFVQRYDPERRETIGGAEARLEGVHLIPTARAAEFAVSPSGALAYGIHPVGRQGLYRVDRDGTQTLLVDSLAEAIPSPRLSPDGRSVVLSLQGDIWRFELGGGSRARLTFNGISRYPGWTRDGARVGFSSRRSDSQGVDLFSRAADGTGQVEALYAAEHDQFEHLWGPDGSLIVRQTVPGTSRDIVYRPAEGGDLRPLLVTDANERGMSLSPDGRWLAYTSDESGRDEIYVRPFPEPEGKFLISTNGGQEPVWAPGGGELFYRSGGHFVAARLEIGQSVRVAERTELFDDVFGTNPDRPEYDVHPTEGWFVFSRYFGPPPEVVWVSNWFEEIREIGR